MHSSLSQEGGETVRLDAEAWHPEIEIEIQNTISEAKETDEGKLS